MQEKPPRKLPVKGFMSFESSPRDFAIRWSFLFLFISGSTEEWMREIKKVQSTLGAMNDYRTVHSLATDLKCDNELRAAVKSSEHRLV